MVNIQLKIKYSVGYINLEHQQFRNYGLSDGLQSTEFTLASQLTDDGMMLFGGMGGIND